MTSDIQNYKKIVEGFYGIGSTTFDVNSQETNNVIGALNKSDFGEFQKNFKARLCRIANAAATSLSIRQFALKSINEVASKKNWDGAYAELVALDFLLSTTRINPTKLELDKTSSASMTIASHMNMSNVDHDFYMRNFDIYIDVKIISDKTGQIIEGIINESSKKIAIKDLKILSFYDLDVSYIDVQIARNAIVKELINAFANGAKPLLIKSQEIPSLEFKLVWNAGVFFGEKSYDPNKHAERHFQLLFQHAKKFHCRRPTLIIFVHFPWASELIPSMGNANVTFYRDLASGFFDSQKSSGVKAKEINSKFVTNITAHEVAQHLAGIVFLDDKCVLGGCDSKSMVDAYFYMNKNYIFLKKTLLIRYFLSCFATNLRALNRASEWSIIKKWLLRITPI